MPSKVPIRLDLVFVDVLQAQFEPASDPASKREAMAILQTDHMRHVVLQRSRSLVVTGHGNGTRYHRGYLQALKAFAGHRLVSLGISRLYAIGCAYAHARDTATRNTISRRCSEFAAAGWIVSSQEALASLEISERELQAWRQRGIILAAHVGEDWYFLPDQVRNLRTILRLPDVAQAAQLISITAEQLSQLMHNNESQCPCDPSGQWRFRPEDLEDATSLWAAMEDEIDANTAAEMLDMSPRKVYGFYLRGAIQATLRLGRRWYKRREIEDLREDLQLVMSPGFEWLDRLLQQDPHPPRLMKANRAAVQLKLNPQNFSTLARWSADGLLPFYSRQLQTKKMPAPKLYPAVYLASLDAYGETLMRLHPNRVQRLRQGDLAYFRKLCEAQGVIPPPSSFQ